MNITMLKLGNVIECKNGAKFLYCVCMNERMLVNLDGEGYLDTNYYTPDLRIEQCYRDDDIFIVYDIMKVYSDYTLQDLIWEREEKPPLSDYEKMFLLHIDKDFRFLLKTKEGKIMLFKDLPYRLNSSGNWSSPFEMCLPFNGIFNGIQVEKPYLISNLLEDE